jgi:hypothetical protein
LEKDLELKIKQKKKKKERKGKKMPPILSPKITLLTVEGVSFWNIYSFGSTYRDTDK